MKNNMIKPKSSIITRVNNEGEKEYHYPDTTLIFKEVDNVLYIKDIDAPNEDILRSISDNEILVILEEFLGEGAFKEFINDFGNRGYTLNSRFDTNSCDI